MARLFIDLRISGTADNGDVGDFAAQAERLRATCVAAGFEVRGLGIELELDAEAAPVEDVEPAEGE